MGRLILVVLQAARFGDGTEVHSRSWRCGLDNAHSTSGTRASRAASCGGSFPVCLQRESRISDPVPDNKPSKRLSIRSIDSFRSEARRSCSCRSGEESRLARSKSRVHLQTATESHGGGFE